MSSRLALLVTGLCIGVGCARQPVGFRVIVLGFDGLDYEVTRTLMAAGRLPNFSRLAATGGFTPLGTTIPPQSPVAWSTFITGMDPGRHGIFDFVHRDPATMEPFLSTTRTSSGRGFALGRWRIPVTGGRVELLRDGQPFWSLLSARGIPTTIVRMPANYPPSGEASRELSGMGTPDLLGTYGTFSFFTTATGPGVAREVPGGLIVPVVLRDGAVHGTLTGPPNPYRRNGQPATVDFEAHVDESRSYVKLVIGAETRLIKAGGWSDWVPIELRLTAVTALHAEALFYVKQVDPDFELYVSPLNLDPENTELRISTPARYARDLASATGRFYTQGMPEDTKALRDGVLTRDEFLAQARIAADENFRQYRHVLNGFHDGLLFYYFGHVDQISHMLWRARDPGHPAYDAKRDRRFEHVIDDLYIELDRVVGETLDALSPKDLLIVMSDHGFTSWRRSFNLNGWLRDQGWLSVRPAAAGREPEIDWTRTQAYGLGLNGLYVNLRGREVHGIVAQQDRAALLNAISTRLLNTVDPATGQPVVRRVFQTDRVYRRGGHANVAPDLVIGYAKGTRNSDESATGLVPTEVLVDNTDQWSGDHCMDPETVPGILLTSRRLRLPATELETLAPSILSEFGISGFPGRE